MPGPPDSARRSSAPEPAPAGSPFSPPTPALPKGGGAIRGIGEKFAANPVTGTGSMTVPLAASPGRSGFGPQLSLSYDSGSGNGPFGFGWSLSLPAITRKTDKGLPRYLDAVDAEDSDVFLLSGSEDLVPIPGPDDQTTAPGYAIRRYRPRIEGLFARIERWTRSDGDVHWRSISKDNVLTLYGKDDESRIFDPEDPRRVFSWLICETRDDKGNAVVYGYKPEDGTGVPLTRPQERNRGGLHDPDRKANRYLEHIRYGNRVPLLDDDGRRPRQLTSDQIETADWMFEVVFDYGEHDENVPRPNGAGLWTYRDDPFSSYRSGFEVRTTRLCQRVLMFHHFEDEAGVGTDCLVRSTDFTYSHERDPGNVRNPVYTFLLAVTQTGYRRQDAGYLKRSLPPVEFEYTQPVVQDTVEEVDAASLENLPIGVDGTAYQWTDLHGEGIPGVLTEQAGGWFYKRNLSPASERPVELAPVELVATKPNLALAGGQAQFMDLAGDGQPDLVVLDGPVPGLYEHDGEESWQPFRPFTSRLHRDTRDPNLKFVDLDGDGHADVLLSEDDAFVWHPSLAEEGFGPARRVQQALDEEKGPRLVFADGTQSIYLADLSGDGLTDLVRIRNGEVCYWPNLGYGRFGAKITMDQAPWFDQPDQFDHKRIRLADIDGTGTTDIIYLHRDGVRLYFNQSGNSWSPPQTLRVFPRVDELAAIVPTDLRGNGSACLVWSSPLPGEARRPMRYVDLMGGQKPHLLIKTVNNLGAETRVEYAPSTKFYLQDKRDGRPWITRLPFPVHVVERVETFDHISGNRFVTRYAYHHGYFDGEEREFRGFGMVEQWDTEKFSALTGDGTLPAATNVDTTSHVPPVHTKTWFHTGIYLGRDHVSDGFAKEYYREPELSPDEVRALLLPDTVLPAGLTLDEEREACRALKGSMLRQEVYALDGSEEEPHPYTVTEQSFTIRVLQRRGDQRHGVFFAHPREALTYHYERHPEDPRVTHALTLEVDDFGNVLRSLAVGYPRANVPGRLPEQNETHLTLTLDRFANRNDQPDWYRAGLPVETRTYEVVKPPAASPRLGWEELRSLVLALVPLDQQAPLATRTVPYEQWDWRKRWDPQAEPGGLVDDEPKHTRLRLIEHVRTLYRRNDLTGPLPLGELHSLALPFETYKLAFTPRLLTHVYGDRIEEPMVATEGRFVHSEGDANWWIPSGQIFYSPNRTDTPPQELAFARQRFFLPHRFRDPFDTAEIPTETVVRYDAHKLLLLETLDPLENRVTIANDYRVLQPRLLTDPNGNRAEVAFDALGLVVGTAVMGKPPPTPVEGDSLAGFMADLEQDQIDGFFAAADPHTQAPTLLAGATTRVVYDLDRFQTTRHDHPEDPTQWLPAYAATLARETHLSDPVPPSGLKIQISFSYSDGFEREIQKKVQAEPEKIGGGAGPPRWVGSGWTVFNNKGKPVRLYEPFFSLTHGFELARIEGVSSVLFYDPLDRVVATLHPSHTYEKVIFDPWMQKTYDVNDTVAAWGPETGDPRTDPDIAGYVHEYFNAQPAGWQTWHAQRIVKPAGDPERDAAEKAAAHANTPTVAHLDALGRPFLTLVHNRFQRNGVEIEEANAIRVELDIEGNQRAVSDAGNRVVMRYDYDLLGNRIYQASMEAGERWTLSDSAGKPIRAWDSRGFLRRLTYDELRRPAGLFVTENGTERLAERTVYGEAQGDASNHRTRVHQVFDGAGIVTSVTYDFKGNLLEIRRDLLPDYRQEVDWKANPAANGGSFTSKNTYDALNRPLTGTSPDGSVYRATFNEANLLDKVDVNLRGAAAATAFVTNIDYDAKGQRKRISYSNGAQSDYNYDPLTYRLTKLKTTRPVDPDATASALFQNAAMVQDLRYTYDPAGNVTRIEDVALKTIVHGGQQVDPVSRYTYDALYQLIEAQGREHIGQTAFEFSPPGGDYRDHPFAGHRVSPNDLQALRNYTQRYEYDAVGNIKFLRHLASGGDWTRGYEYEEESLLETGKPSNRLTRTKIGNGINRTEAYTHDAHGNMTAMRHLAAMAWDFEDQLRKVDLGGGGTAYYVYDVAGERVRKVIDDQTGARRTERIDLGGFEIYREYSGGGVELERESLHVMDDQRRIALVDTRTIESGSPVDPPVSIQRYQLGNHLGSAGVELDKDGALISYEEYHPYGTTAFQGGRSAAEASLKRYRYTGKERDEETGLYYHGARYYAPWLGRWTSCDPLLNLVPGNVYAYCEGRPIIMVDPDGKQGEFRAGITLGFQVGSHENRFYLQADVFAAYRNQFVAETGLSITTFPFLTRWGLNRPGWETSVTLSGALGGERTSTPSSTSTLPSPTDLRIVGGFATTWYSAKDMSEIGDPSSSFQPLSGFALSDQRLGIPFLRVDSGDNSFQISTRNDTALLGGDSGDSFRTARVDLLYTRTTRTPTEITDYQFGLTLDLVTGLVDRSKRLSGTNPERYDMRGQPFGDLSQGALFFTFGVAHGSIYQDRSFNSLGGHLSLGLDAEIIRHLTQNRLIHDPLDTPHFPMLDRPARPYFEIDARIGAGGLTPGIGTLARPHPGD